MCICILYIYIYITYLTWKMEGYIFVSNLTILKVFIIMS